MSLMRNDEVPVELGEGRPDAGIWTCGLPPGLVRRRVVLAGRVTVRGHRFLLEIHSHGPLAAVQSRSRNDRN
ncbi:hypothetical protein CEXT_56771 [Caerostris extrusa]|uniref:Uncharacterized protein n=1 Tax=Caerostris extrusa TaxID=172846 RepID=A0AAV4TUG2_CAEEX|nr:hypothetical protein CEXT_56771 [Caerostris extrusa]